VYITSLYNIINSDNSVITIIVLDVMCMMSDAGDIQRSTVQVGWSHGNIGRQSPVCHPADTHKM